MCLVQNNSRHASNTFVEKPQGHEVSSTETIDRLTELPKDVVLLILSSFTTKEVKRISVVSKRWNEWLLGYYPKLKFKASKTLNDRWFEIRNNDNELAKEKSSFIRRVDHVMKQHMDSSIDEFSVKFDLDCSYQPCVDRWVDFALAKHVRTLKLNFQSYYPRPDTSSNRCGLTIKGVNHQSLTSLCLSYVKVTSEIVESVLLSCPFLENLSIECTEFLTSVRPRAPVSLKHFDVSYCENLETIDISASKMEYFRYLGQPIELNIRNAVSLSSLFIGGGPTEDITYAFEPLSMYLPQLEALYLHINMPNSMSEWNTGIEHLQLPVLSKVKVLDLYIEGSQSACFLGWTPLIEACPALEKLTVKNNCYDSGANWRVLSRRNGSPLASLKTLELLGYTGRRIDIELAAFIFENAINLQDVIVQLKSISFKRTTPLPPARLCRLKSLVPRGVRFILMDSKWEY